MPKRKHGEGGKSSPALNDAHRSSRAIGETMERLDVLIALRKASESHPTGKEKKQQGGRGLMRLQTKGTNGRRGVNLRRSPLRRPRLL